MFTSVRTQWHAEGSQRYGMVATAATCAVLLVWAGVATIAAFQTSQRLAEANARVGYLSWAADAAQLGLLRSAEMHRVFGELQPYQDGFNPLNCSYLEHFETRENTIAVFLRNDGRQPVRRNFEIRFLNTFGFVTATYRDSPPDQWLPAGAQCVSEGGLDFRYGHPVYYSVAIPAESDASSG